MSARTTTTLPSTNLTVTEKRILDLLVEFGYSDSEIAAQLICSVRTITTHFVNIRTKLLDAGIDADNRCKLLLYWQRTRITK